VSIVHRVVPLQKRQDEDRYSIGYFLRMDDDAEISYMTGKKWTAKEWHDLKYDVQESEYHGYEGAVFDGYGGE
jgi:isopenicillin N synthase-like dioxygenase